MEGFLLIDKPTGITSHDVVAIIRHALQPPTTNHQPLKVGHAGTLDPFATGLLIVGVGRAATREMEKLVGLDKTYEAVFVLGAKSDTDDRTGRIEEAPIGNLPPTPPSPPSAFAKATADKSGRGEISSLEGVLKRFIGEIEQVPPAYSAIKIGGKKMYEEARKGKPMVAAPRRVTIYSIKTPPNLPLVGGGDYRLPLTIHCSSGTYIRALARDLGEALGGGGYVDELRRTTIGPFSIDETKALDEIKNCLNTSIIPIPQVLDRILTHNKSTVILVAK